MNSKIKKKMNKHTRRDIPTSMYFYNSELIILC
nr:MAG TPA: hypothetical protein [Caudoviricetes sp.]